MRGLDHVTLTNHRTGTCHPGMLSTMLWWWHLAFCLFLFLTASSYFNESPANQRSAMGSSDQWEDRANVNQVMGGSENATMTGGTQEGWEELRGGGKQREHRSVTWALLRRRIQDTILSILKQTMRHKAGETIAQFSLGTAGSCAWLPSQNAFKQFMWHSYFYLAQFSPPGWHWCTYRCPPVPWGRWYWLRLNLMQSGFNVLHLPLRLWGWNGAVAFSLSLYTVRQFNKMSFTPPTTLHSNPIESHSYSSSAC